MNQMETIETLLANGWRSEMQRRSNSSYATRLYKLFDTPTRCSASPDRPGIQVECTVWQFPRDSCAELEIDVAALTPDDKWVNIRMSCDDLDDMDNQIPRLLATWEFVANFQAGKE